MSPILGNAIPNPYASFFVELERILSERLRLAFASPWLLLSCKLIIGFVSAYDIFLTIKYYESLPAMELNPIGRWLMQLDTGPNCELDQIACFITSKFAGNFITLATLEFLSSWKRSIAIVVGVAVACAQLILLFFLIFGVNGEL
ncbi:MAG: hypothetical protein ACE361_16550 [Aureliella sp.]